MFLISPSSLLYQQRVKSSGSAAHRLYSPLTCLCGGGWAGASSWTNRQPFCWSNINNTDSVRSVSATVSSNFQDMMLVSCSSSSSNREEAMHQVCRTWAASWLGEWRSEDESNDQTGRKTDREQNFVASSSAAPLRSSLGYRSSAVLLLLLLLLIVVVVIVRYSNVRLCDGP